VSEKGLFLRGLLEKLGPGFWGVTLKMKKMKNEIGSHCLLLLNYFPSISTIVPSRLFDFVLFYYQIFSCPMH